MTAAITPFALKIRSALARGLCELSTAVELARDLLPTGDAERIQTLMSDAINIGEQGEPREMLDMVGRIDGETRLLIALARREARP